MTVQVESRTDAYSFVDHRQKTSPLQLQCPVCRNGMGFSIDRTVCAACGFAIARHDGIYHALTPDAEKRFKQFIHEYQLVREKEGRGSNSANYYLALPFRDVTGNNAWQWSIRAQTFRHFQKRILPRLSAAYPTGASILDVGAGNGWFSYRLAKDNHHPIALDLLTNSSDGLGAAYHFFPQLNAEFPRFQAEMDRLPFAGRQFDAVVFNASFHYSVNYEITLRESLRCLRRPGYLIIADSPFYRRRLSGQQMVKERQHDFTHKFGFASNSVEAQEFLTGEVLVELSRSLGIHWNVEKPWYGIDWALRPLKARILRKREPSKFYLIWARVDQ